MKQERDTYYSRVALKLNDKLYESDDQLYHETREVSPDHLG